MADQARPAKLAAIFFRIEVIAKSWIDIHEWLWRMHSCVPCRHSCPHLVLVEKNSVHTSVNVARRSACATSNRHRARKTRIQQHRHPCVYWPYTTTGTAP